MGSISPLSTRLAGAVRARLDEALAGRFRGPEMRLVRPILELQARWSRIPASGELLIERLKLFGAHHDYVFSFSFGGRSVHEGLAALVAHRMTRIRPCSVAVTGNDYGFELTTHEDLALDESAWRSLLSPDRLVEDLLGCLNDTELARRRFRGIARVAGLVFPGLPGQAKTARELQASSNLFYEVFREHDPNHLLLEQARREVLEAELEVMRLRALLERLQGQSMPIVRTARLTPLAFPLWADSMRTQHVSSESWRTRVERMARKLEEAAAKPSSREPSLASG
jgi:ATP-dependent Lhr-like helicase